MWAYSLYREFADTTNAEKVDQQCLAYEEVFRSRRALPMHCRRVRALTCPARSYALACICPVRSGVWFGRSAHAPARQ